MTTITRTPSSPTPAAMKAARVKLNLTQTQAAAVIGYSKRGWQDAELGNRSMRPSSWELFLIKTKGG